MRDQIGLDPNDAAPADVIVVNLERNGKTIGARIAAQIANTRMIHDPRAIANLVIHEASGRNNFLGIPTGFWLTLSLSGEFVVSRDPKLAQKNLVGSVQRAKNGDAVLTDQFGGPIGSVEGKKAARMARQICLCALLRKPFTPCYWLAKGLDPNLLPVGSEIEEWLVALEDERIRNRIAARVGKVSRSFRVAYGFRLQHVSMKTRVGRKVCGYRVVAAS